MGDDEEEKKPDEAPEEAAPEEDGDGDLDDDEEAKDDDEDEKEEEDEEKEEESKGGRSSFCYMLFCCICCIILAAIIIAIVIPVARRRRDRNKSSTDMTMDMDNNDMNNNNTAGDDAPTPSPTLSNFNERCEDAMKVPNVITSLSGTTATSEAFNEATSCGVSPMGSAGAWFFVEPKDDTLMSANACAGTDFEAMVSVYFGNCASLTCVANSARCSNGGSVRWNAERGLTYYIFVHGYRGQTGRYSLDVGPVTSSSECSEAEGPLSIGTTLLGSTADSDLLMMPSCGNVDFSLSPATWFRFNGIDASIRAVISTDFEWDGQISLFSGTCRNLVCLTSSNQGGITNFPVERGERYYLVVNGVDADDYGDFRLTLERDPPPIPANDNCNNARQIIPNGDPLVGTNEYARSDRAGACGYFVFHTAPGVWYYVDGRGFPLIASTCNGETDFDTQISVFRGSCSELQCIDGNDQDPSCDYESSIAWNAENDVRYYIFVSGHDGDEGTFELSLDRHNPTVEDECSNAAEIDESNLGFPMIGDTENAMEIRSPCDNAFGPGVWYEVDGTGNKMTASTCHPGTDITTTVSVLTGNCENLDCVSTEVYECGEQMSVTWVSQVAKKYRILVQGSGKPKSGNYVLTIRDTPSNSRCEAAEGVLSLSNSVVYGSTEFSTITFSSDRRCGNDLSQSRGLWYALEGNGDEITLSTCNFFTTFDTYISVFTGTCNVLQCIAANDDFCGRQSSVSFDSEVGVRYYILIQGYEEDDLGNFELDIDSS